MASQRVSRLIKILFTSGTSDSGEEVLALDGRLERFTHFWVLVVRQFIRHRCLVRASALSYSTLLALIPLLAVALSVTSTLLKSKDEAQFQGFIEKMVATVTPPADITTNDMTLPDWGDWYDDTGSAGDAAGGDAEGQAAQESVVTVSAQKEIAKQIWGFVHKMQSGALGGTGVALLLFVAISLLRRIEETFNDVWGVTRGRNWLHQIQLYSTTLLLGPLLLVVALGLAGGSQFQSAKHLVLQMPVVGKLLFQLLPLLVLWLAFTFVYQLVPNTRVRFSAAMVGGAVAAVLWQLNSYFGFLYVSRVINNLNFYGSLGLIPVFMVGVYFSWLFLLLGAQMAYAFQNRSTYLQDRLADTVNQRGREFVALRLMTSLAQRFQSGLRPATALQLSDELGVPARLTQSVLRVLVRTRLVTETSGAEPAYAPARPLENISAHDVLCALRAGNGQDLPLAAEPALKAIYGEFARIEQAERNAAAKISLRALADRLPEPQALPEPEGVEETVKLDAFPIIPPKERDLPPPDAPPHPVIRPDEDRGFPL